MSASLSERTWASFTAAEHTLGPTPGLRTRWHAGRQHYAAWMVRVDGPVLRERVAQLQRALGPWIRPVPLDELHITLRVAGFLSPRPYEDPGFPVADHTMSGTLEATLRRLPALAPRLQIGPASSFASAPFLEVRDPVGDLARCRALLTRAGADEVRESPWLPHLTVGTWRRRLPIGAPARCLERHRSWRPITPQMCRTGLAIINPITSTIRQFTGASIS
jgi:2'-5' RNA ligase